MSAAAPPPTSGAHEPASSAPEESGAAGGDVVRVAAPSPPVVLKKRRDFVLAANRGQRLGLPGLHLQARRRRAEEPAEAPVRVGYTCSKKVGGAVQRNRAKRRLRAAAAQVLPDVARSGWDYVLIGRRDQTAERPFPALLADLAEGIARLHARADKAEAAGRDPAADGRPPRVHHGRGRGETGR